MRRIDKRILREVESKGVLFPGFDTFHHFTTGWATIMGKQCKQQLTGYNCFTRCMPHHLRPDNVLQLTIESYWMKSCESLRWLCAMLSM